MPISIIIPSFNRASILKRTLESISSQTSDDWECIVVDDHSVDDTKSVVKSFCEKSSKFSYYLNERKKGAQGARNTGLGHAKYDWVIFFDSDNIMHPDFVETMISCISKCKDYDVIACCSDVVDVDKGKTGKIMNPRCNGDIHDNLFSLKSYVDFNQAIIRCSSLKAIGGLDEDCPSMQEWDTHIRLSVSARYTMINRCLIDYYVGGGDAISSNPKREIIGRLYILNKHLQDWKKRNHAITIFAYQIYRLIEKIDDKQFACEKLRELRNLVPYFNIRIAICILWSYISKNRNK